jgi:septation ring formation regulator EzrA
MYTFTDRTSYLEQVKAWALAYAELSTNIRKAKIALKEAARKGETLYRHIGNLEGLQQQARDEIEWRHGSKEEANRQYLAQKVS